MCVYIKYATIVMLNVIRFEDMSTMVMHCSLSMSNSMAEH